MISRLEAMEWRFRLPETPETWCSPSTVRVVWSGLSCDTRAMEMPSHHGPPRWEGQACAKESTWKTGTE